MITALQPPPSAVTRDYKVTFGAFARHAPHNEVCDEEFPTERQLRSSLRDVSRDIKALSCCVL